MTKIPFFKFGAFSLSSLLISGASGAGLAPVGRKLRAATTRLTCGDKLAVAIMCACILAIAHEYIDPRLPGLPAGIDLGDDLAYMGTLRSELLNSNRLMTWWSVAYDGIPLAGHPLSQLFYPPLIIPSLAFGTTAGVRVAYVFSLLLAGTGMYTLVRILGPRPLVAAWAGLLFTMGGGLGSRIHAGHLEKVLAMPFIPLVLASALLAGRAGSWRGSASWAGVTGLLHGITFLAGDSYIPLFLLFALPIIFVINTRGEFFLSWRRRLLLVMGAWVAGLLLATAGKLIAATSVLAETVRSVAPYSGSQDSHWFIVHLAFPFFSTVPGLTSFSYGVEQRFWGWGWWEYTQYIGVFPVVLALLALGALLFERLQGVTLVSRGLRYREIAALLGVVLMAALWLANAQWYSPVHWLFEVATPLQSFRVPSRSLMLAAPIFLALAAIGLDGLLQFHSGRFNVASACIAAAGLAGAWWANASWLRPVRWFCDGVPGLSGAPLPVCLVVVAIVGILLAAAMFFWARRSTAPSRRRALMAGLALAALFALGDLFHATRAIVRVEEAPSARSLQRIVEELKSRDPGPILVILGPSEHGYAGKRGMYINKSVKFDFVDRGIAVAEDVSPLVPRQQSQHQVIGLDRRLRYRVTPAIPKPVLGDEWTPIMRDGDVLVFVNDRADGDAWVVNGGEITPLKVANWGPGRFQIVASAPTGAMVVVPANAFRGWHVSVDGGPLNRAVEFDGYAAAPAEPGEHTYRFVYKEPMLAAILVLGFLPWVLGLGLATWGAVVWFNGKANAA